MTGFHYVSKLYPYQREGVEYIVEHGGGFIWDDPGLGKTRQAIVSAHELGGPIIVVCPNSLKQWWKREILELYPNASVCTAGQGGRFGTRNKLSLPERRPYPKWWVVHYTGARMNEELWKMPWSVVILDECHYIKNRKAERSKAIMKMTPPYAYRIGLTATPFGNNPADVWHQLRWLAPQVDGLKSYWRFFQTFVDYEFEHRGRQKYRKVKGGKNLELLAKVMSAYGIRRSKKEVASHLPPITDTMVPLELEGKQKATYEKLKDKSKVELNIPGDMDGPAYKLVIPNALARMLRMEQWLSHPWKFRHGVKGAKFEWLEEWVSGYNEQGVIAVRFKETARYITNYLYKHKLSAKTPITGNVSTGIRQNIIDRWKDGEFQFIVGTIATIGTGFSFENAHAMVLYDILWSTIQMDQVRHRIHRITTTHPVQIIYPYLEDTTNEIILDSFRQRWKQVEMVRCFVEHIRGSGD